MSVQLRLHCFKLLRLELLNRPRGRPGTGGAQQHMEGRTDVGDDLARADRFSSNRPRTDFHLEYRHKSHGFSDEHD